MGDTAQSTIDSALEAPNAITKLVPLSLVSSLLPALNGLTANLPTFESKTPGGNANVTGSALDLASPGGVLGLPLGLLGGSLIPTSLTTALDGAGARTGLDAALANLSAVSGLLKVNSVSNKQGTAAALSASSGNRALTVDAISLLSLGDLLAGLNLDLAKLPLGIVSNLLSTLQLPVALPGGAADLKSAVDGLTSTISGILTQVAGNNALLGSVVDAVPAVDGLLSGLSLTSLVPLGGSSLVPVDLTALGLGTVSDLLGTLQGTLSNLLDTVLGTLGNLSLLKLDGATIGATTKAADTLANSAADVTGKLGGLSVLGLNLPGLDLLSVGNTINAVTSQLGNVLGIIDPSLKDLVKVGVLDKATSVTAANGYNNALAGIDILSVKITPPALLSNLVGTLTGNGALSALGTLTAAGAPTSGLPLLGGNILGLGNLLNLPATVGVLTKGLSLKVGSVQSSSQFRLASAPAPAAVAAPQESLPRTGADTRTLGILAAGMAALALGVRRWARRPEEMID
ncbi:MAG TPA: hypothetical protein VHM89_14045 [Acidimicrobiales bacterium]|nr:hypothetical protein [Acidimicrobiales bacterium]